MANGTDQKRGSGIQGRIRLQPETPPVPKAAQKAPPSASTKIARDPGAATARDVAEVVSERHPYLKMAFVNPFNLSLLGGGIAASVLTLNPLPALVAGGLEALWLVWGPDSTLLQRKVWDPRIDASRRAVAAADRNRRLSLLAEPERERVERLSARREEIEILAAQNPSFTGELLRGELGKADRLVESFLDMALTCARYEYYLGSVDARVLQRDVDRYAEAVRRGAADDPATELHRKNLAIVVKRQERMHEIERFLSVARGQLDLIEHSFDLIADQIVTMQSPRELSGQLDELLSGVEAIRETSRDTEKLLEPSGSFEP
jgi:hypothetical protein